MSKEKFVRNQPHVNAINGSAVNFSILDNDKCSLCVPSVGNPTVEASRLFVENDDRSSSWKKYFDDYWDSQTQTGTEPMNKNDLVAAITKPGTNERVVAEFHFVRCEPIKWELSSGHNEMPIEALLFGCENEELLN
jgi:hypothetical protein